MSYTAERGDFEGRSRAQGGFGNETGQTGRRGSSGEAERANRNAMNRAATGAAPSGPFKSPIYDATWQNLAKLGAMVGPMIANPGIGLATPLAKAILSDDPYEAFGMPRGWSSYSQRDINPMGTNPRGNIGGRGGPVMPYQSQVVPPQVQRPKQPGLPKAPNLVPAHPRYYPPIVLSDQVPGLPFYGATAPGYGSPTRGKAAGYGGTPRVAPIAFPTSHL